MDPGSYIALSPALGHSLPSVVEQLLLSLERERMAREDLAMLALDGRVVANCDLDPTYRLIWRHLVWKYSGDCDEHRERARLALQRVEAKGWMPGEGKMMDQIRELLNLDEDVDTRDYSDLSEEDDESDAGMEG